MGDGRRFCFDMGNEAEEIIRYQVAMMLKYYIATCMLMLFAALWLRDLQGVDRGWWILIFVLPLGLFCVFITSTPFGRDFASNPIFATVCVASLAAVTLQSIYYFSIKNVRLVYHVAACASVVGVSLLSPVAFLCGVVVCFCMFSTLMLSVENSRPSAVIWVMGQLLLSGLFPESLVPLL